MTKVCHMTSVHRVTDSRIFHREALSLAKNGWDTTLIGVHDEDMVCEGVKILGVPNVSSRIKRVTLQTLRVLIKAWHVDADIYHFHDPELIFAGLILKLFKRAYVVNDVHEDHKLIMFKHYIPKKMRKLISIIVNKVENLSAGLFDAVVTPTYPITERFARFAHRAVTLYNFPADSFIKCADKAKVSLGECSYDITHVGTLREDRLRFLLNVAAHIQSKIGPKKWIFVGMPVRLEEIVKQFVKQHKLENITVIKTIPYLEVPKIISRCKVAVNFHPLGEAHTEVAIPVKIFEYLACGLPVVSTPLPLVKKLLREAPMVRLVNDNLEEFSTGLIELLRHADLASMRDMAFEFSRKKYRWLDEEKKLLELYGDILQKQNHNGKKINN